MNKNSLPPKFSLGIVPARIPYVVTLTSCEICGMLKAVQYLFQCRDCKKYVCNEHSILVTYWEIQMCTACADSRFAVRA